MPLRSAVTAGLGRYRGRVTTTSAPRLAIADASVVTSFRGWPSWAVILLAVVLTLVGTAIDGFTTGVLAWGLRIGFYIGVIGAALIVRRGSIFTAMVQPPLVLVVRDHRRRDAVHQFRRPVQHRTEDHQHLPDHGHRHGRGDPVWD